MEIGPLINPWAKLSHLKYSRKENPNSTTQLKMTKIPLLLASFFLFFWPGRVLSVLFDLNTTTARWGIHSNSSQALADGEIKWRKAKRCPGSHTHGGRAGISSSAVLPWEHPLTAIRHCHSGQVGSLHPPSSINRVLAAIHQHYLHRTLWDPQVFHLGQLRPGLLGQAGTGVLGPCPSARWHRAGAAAHHRPCDGETRRQSWSGKNQWCPNSSILGRLDNPLSHLELWCTGVP